VKTITGHPERQNPFGDAVKAHLFNFDKPELLTETLRGCEVLYNTYWVRFDYGETSFDRAEANTRVLFECAKRAGVRRIVHVSIAKPSETDELPYYRGKARLERALIESGVPHSIVRPTVVFGREDILINNIAWTIRNFPLAPVFGKGDYKLQPIYVEDLASIMIESASRSDSLVMDAAGPETFTYEELIKVIRAAIGGRARIFHVWPWLGLVLGRVIGFSKRDVLLTKHEMIGLMGNKLCSDEPPRGTTKFTEWLAANRDTVGTSYMSELGRHYRWREG
jgi:NADH dehydrogenase